MDIKTKYALGDILTTKTTRYVGKVIKIEVSTVKGSDGINTDVIYTLDGNERTARLNEGELFRLQLEQEAQ